MGVVLALDGVFLPFTPPFLLGYNQLLPELTNMVNNQIQGRQANPFARQIAGLPWRPPNDADEQSRHIAGNVWELADVQVIAKMQLQDETATLLSAVTADCTADLQKWELTAVDVAERLLQLRTRHYDKSLWCKKSKYPGVVVPNAQLWLPCDAYVIRISERVASTGWEGSVEYYFKICLTLSKKIVLLVSVHP